MGSLGALSVAWKALGIGVAAVVLLVVIALALLGWWSRRPHSIALVGGRLRPCPPTPNCVCSDEAARPDPSQQMPPIPLKTDPKDALDRLQQAALSLGRATVRTRTENYLHLEFRSRLFGFVDDVEFLVDPERARIDFRAGARVGHSDLGVNRARMERILKLADAP